MAAAALLFGGITNVDANELPWSVGMDDDAWPTELSGGGANTAFVQEGGANELPGGHDLADDDYYWAGDYSTVIDGNGDYEPIGEVPVNEESAERAFTTWGDNELRYHFNLPESLQATDQLIISYDALALDNQSPYGSRVDPRYGVEVYFNNVLVQPEVVIRSSQLYQKYNTNPFTLADVNAEVGLGYDNIITLKGVPYSGEGGGDYMGFDYVQLSKAPSTAHPLTESRWVVTQGATEWREIYDFGDLSGDASYEFFFNATKAGASTSIAGNNAFAFKLDQWNEQSVFGTTVFGVVDNVFTAVEGKSVASVFDRDVHVVFANDTAAEETRLYVDGEHVGVLNGNFEFAGEARVMAARIGAINADRTEETTDPMGDGSVMHKWAVYNSALSGAKIADLAAAVGVGESRPAVITLKLEDQGITLSWDPSSGLRLFATDSLNGGQWTEVEGVIDGSITLNTDQQTQFYQLMESSYRFEPGDGEDPATIQELGFRMMPIPAGTFVMGDAWGVEDLWGDFADEAPLTTVTITKPFWLGQTEVTQAQWEAVMGNSPSYRKGANLPVERVSWNDAIAFCEKLNEMKSETLPEGYYYNLPTEAQWEYACRAGTKSRFYFGNGAEIDDPDPETKRLVSYAWYKENSLKVTHPVGEKLPNGWGLHDMYGNVSEWCLDGYSDSYPGGNVSDPQGPQDSSERVFRGGSWYFNADYCRSANRDKWPLEVSDDSRLGFRVALSPVPPE